LAKIGQLPVVQKYIQQLRESATVENSTLWWYSEADQALYLE